MIKLENWVETMHGIFVYVINANCRYEIQIMYHAKDANILTANASLYYVVGEWTRTGIIIILLKENYYLKVHYMYVWKKLLKTKRGWEAYD